MYHHPGVQCAELGLGGRSGRLVVWLFGTEWTTPRVNLRLSQWYSLCLTWTQTKDRPALYVDGNPVDIMAGGLNNGQLGSLWFVLYVTCSYAAFLFW